MAFEFDRYINGKLMAEGVIIERQKNLADAMREAARIASRGPNGEVPVLVLRALAERAGGVKVDRRVLNMAISKWATDSDLHITIGDVEALHLAILSALEPAAPEGRQQEAVTPRSLSIKDGVITAAYDSNEDAQAVYDLIEPGFIRPSEQAVTEAMRRIRDYADKPHADRYVIRNMAEDALKAAMEAGR